MKKEVETKEAVWMEEPYEPNLSDFAFFLSVMKVKEAHRDILSIILDEDDMELVEVKVEEVVLNRSGKRAIRMDAWLWITKTGRLIRRCRMKQNRMM